MSLLGTEVKDIKKLLMFLNVSEGNVPSRLRLALISIREMTCSISFVKDSE